VVRILPMITCDIRHYEHFIRRECGKLGMGEEIEGVFMVLLLPDECSDLVEYGCDEQESAVLGVEIVKLMELVKNG